MGQRILKREIDYMSADKEELKRVNDKISHLRMAIQRAFPAVPYTGSITRHDGAWLPELTEENAIHDDDEFLCEALKGRKWTDVPKDFLYAMPGDFVLLTEQALVAFLAAWLMSSLENIEGDNLVRECLVYAFSPTGVTPTADFIRTHLRALSPEQQAVVRSLLEEFSRAEHSDYIRKQATDAVEFIDNFRERLTQ